MSRGMYPEAKGVLDLTLGEAKPGQEDFSALIVHSVASTLMGRPEQGLKDLASPAIGTNYDSQLWKALALARQGKWAEAREKFKNVEFAVTSLPLELQRAVLTEAMRASIEVKDYAGAASRGNDLDVIGIPADLNRRSRCCAGGWPRRWGARRTRWRNTRRRPGPPIARPRWKRGCSKSRCARSATRSARKTRCAISKRCR